MTAPVGKAPSIIEEKVAEKKKEEVKFNPADYWCEIIFHFNFYLDIRKK